ncbi:hypothetical protein GJAV_G00114160 [Gymnothorax javanicus]|nr:hypothetical protein GJAV_G00114160 [Gymnothorax javanicus]
MPLCAPSGLEAELYYVRDDVISHQALSFIMPVPSETNSLHFTWLSKNKVDYKLGFLVDNTAAMSVPESNISTRGEVPQSLSVFRVDLLCSGKVSTEVLLTVQLNLTIISNNFTVLNFKRRKMCYKRIEPLDPKISPNTNMNISKAGADVNLAPTSSTRVFYISVGVYCAVIFLVAIVLAVLHLHSIKRLELDDSATDSGSSQGLSMPSTQTTQYLRADTPNNATPVTKEDDDDDDDCPSEGSSAVRKFTRTESGGRKGCPRGTKGRGRQQQPTASQLVVETTGTSRGGVPRAPRRAGPSRGCQARSSRGRGVTQSGESAVAGQDSEERLGTSRQAAPRPSRRPRGRRARGPATLSPEDLIQVQQFQQDRVAAEQQQSLTGLPS